MARSQRAGMMIDIKRVRADTPACANIIHFNNAGASLVPNPVHSAVVDYLELERSIGGYEAHAATQPEHAALYDNLAKLLGAKPHETAYVENATRAWDMAFYAFPFREGDRILTHGPAEYVSNYLAFLQQAERRGLVIDHAPSDGSGQVDVDALERAIKPRTALIAVTHVPTQTGLINPVADIGAIAKRHGIAFMVDACQSAGQMPLDVAAIGCDVLSGTGRKFLRGPRGTGFLYVSDAIIERLDPPFIDLHSARWVAPDAYEFVPGAKRFENWESFFAGRLGLSAAIDYALGIGIEAIEARVQTLAARLRDELGAVDGVTVADRGARLSAIVTFGKDGEPAPALAARLKRQGINVSVSSLGSARLDFPQRGIESLVRASVHYYNTDAEIDRLVEAVAERPA